jgi:hypothetical protein
MEKGFEDIPELSPLISLEFVRGGIRQDSKNKTPQRHEYGSVNVILRKLPSCDQLEQGSEIRVIDQILTDVYAVVQPQMVQTGCLINESWATSTTET